MTDDELEACVVALDRIRAALHLEHDSTLQDVIDTVLSLCRGIATEWDRRGLSRE